MSHLVKDLIKAYDEKKPISLGPLSGYEFKRLILELKSIRKGGDVK